MAAYPPMTRSFFGGAIQASLPVEFRDLSTVRQVPDNQECWISDTDVLFVLECLELDGSRDVQSAAQHYWSDLCIANESTQESLTSFSFTMDLSAVRRMPDSAVVGGVGYQRVMMGRAVDASGNPREQEERHVRVELCLIRLPSVQTDLLLTLSTPMSNTALHDDGNARSSTFQTALSTLEIKDWSLFG